jgi:hypothetical protein
MALAWAALVILAALVAVVIVKKPVGGLVEKAFILDRNLWALILAVLALRAPALQQRAASD